MLCVTFHYPFLTTTTTTATPIPLPSHRTAAPNYGRGAYSDFNTFYYQAASSTSGGSSGSPVLNIRGQAVALNAGASSLSSQSYFLPLDRIERALRLLQQDKPVLRGTIQMEWRYVAFDEVRRLGLEPDLEVEFRKAFPDRIGVLVANQILVDGPAHRLVETGDILLRVNGRMLSHFIELEAILDESIGATIVLQVQRGTDVVNVEVEVQDLHSITPNEYVEMDDGVFHSLSYQMARSFPSARIGSVFVACSGYSFSTGGIASMSVILSVNRLPTPDLATFVEVLRRIPDGQETVVKYYNLGGWHRQPSGAGGGEGRGEKTLLCLSTNTTSYPK